MRQAELTHVEQQMARSIECLAAAKLALSDAYLARAQLFQELSQILAETPDIIAGAATTLSQQSALETQVSETQSALVQGETSLAQIQSTLESAERALVVARGAAKSLLAEAKKTPLIDETKAQFELLPESLDELDSAIAEAEALAALTADISHKIVEEWDRRDAHVWIFL